MLFVDRINQCWVKGSFPNDWGQPWCHRGNIFPTALKTQNIYSTVIIPFIGGNGPKQVITKNIILTLPRRWVGCTETCKTNDISSGHLNH